MISKNSFFKALKEDRKRRIWTIIVFAFLCFMLTAAFEISIETCELNYTSSGMTLLESLTRMTEYEMLTTYIIFSGIAAVLFGFQGFGWLTKKEQVDFYHSQPMKREKRFAVIFVNGVILFVSFMALYMIVAALLIAARGCLTGTIIMNFALNAGLFTLCFLLFYSIVILAIMMTGNLIVSVMASLTFLLYSSLVKYLFQAYFMTFYDTYCNQYSNSLGFLSQIAPNEKVILMINMVIRGQYRELKMVVLTIVVMTIVFFLAAFFLYKKRPSECAGNALAFPITRDVIRISIVIPGSLLFGILFYSISGMNRAFWLYFGIVIGVVLTHGFMEAIFHFDIKVMFKKKVQLAGSIILTIVIGSIFYLDLAGYDTYLPDANDLKEISYYIDVTEQPSTYAVLNEEGIPMSAAEYGGLEDDYDIDLETYELQTSGTEDVVPILHMIDAHLKKEYDDEMATKRIVVCYKKNSGKKVYRQYEMDANLLKEYYTPIYNTEKGKEIHHPYLKLSSEMISSVSGYAPYMDMEKALDLKKDEINELIECYKKDLKERSFEQFFEENIVGVITLYYNNSIDHATTQIQLYVSYDYENMRHFLEKKGMYFNIPNEDYLIEEVIANNPMGEDSTRNHAFWKGQPRIKLTEEQAAEVIPYFISDEYIYSYDKYEFSYPFDVVVRNKKTGAKRQVYYYVREENAPEYMKIK